MLELTATQRDIYLEGELFGAVVNNIGGYQKYTGHLDVPRFLRARQLLLHGNDAYRLRFVEQSGGHKAVLQGAAPLDIVRVDLSSAHAPQVDALSWIQRRFELPFTDLAQDCFDDALLKLSEDEYWYFAKAHHLIMDGWGFALQMERLLGLYEALASQKLHEEAVSWPSFADYMERRARDRSCAAYEKSKAYWLERCTSLPPVLMTPHKFDAVPTSRRVSTTLNNALFDGLARVANKAGANIGAVFHAALYTYFSRAYQCKSLLIASPIHNRRNAVEKATIGSFVNVNIDCISANPGTTFSELVEQIAQWQKQDYRHGRFPIGDLTRALRDRLQSHDRPVYELGFNLQKLDFALRVDGHAVETHYLSHHRERLPMTFVVCDYGPNQDVAFHLDYSVAHVNDDEAVATLDRMTDLLRQVTINSSRDIADYDILTRAERVRQFVTWNETALPVREGICLHWLFEEQAQRTPDHVAVAHGEEKLSYRELNERANSLTCLLIQRGAEPGDLVGLCHTRTPNLLIALLAILKAGCAYVPVDPSYPAARVAYLLRDSGVRMVIVDSLGAEMIQPNAGYTVVDSGAQPAPVDAVEAPDVSRASGLAYVIYTSGSTGKPKGVLIEHRNAVSLVQWALAVYAVDDLEVVLAATSICFDLSVFEIFVPLSAGGRVLLVDDVLSLRDNSGYSPTLINTVPSAMQALLEANAIPPSVRCINLAGEPLRQDLVDALHERREVSVYDLYGPSEGTTYSTYARRERHGRETIGRPIANTQVYVLDSAGHALPTGMTGELCIAGAGLARGYLKGPEATAERFVFNEEAERRIYRTGDLVRYLPDGQIEYLGRQDNQIKIRGFRVEPGEIEAALKQNSAVRECIVMARQDILLDATVLVAYVVACAADEAGDKLSAALLAALADQLPAHMVPSRIVWLTALPLMPNGKVDRQALPLPNAAESRAIEYVAPTNDMEQRLFDEWSAVLGATPPGMHANFFSEGGDSLSLVKLSSGLERAFGVRITISSLSSHPTLAAQARLIAECTAIARLYANVSVGEREQNGSYIDL